MSQRDIFYYSGRLRFELAAAAAASDEGARSSHEGLAHLYAELLAGRGHRVLPASLTAAPARAA